MCFSLLWLWPLSLPAWSRVVAAICLGSCSAPQRCVRAPLLPSSPWTGQLCCLPAPCLAGPMVPGRAPAPEALLDTAAVCISSELDITWHAVPFLSLWRAAQLLLSWRRLGFLEVAAWLSEPQVLASLRLDGKWFWVGDTQWLEDEETEYCCKVCINSRLHLHVIAAPLCNLSFKIHNLFFLASGFLEYFSHFSF